jgi:hypothetical protein
MQVLFHGATNESTSQGWNMPVAGEDPRRRKRFTYLGFARGNEKGFPQL